MIALYLTLRVFVWCVEVTIKVTFWVLSWIIALVLQFCEYLQERKEAKEHGPYQTEEVGTARRAAHEEAEKPQAFYSNRR